MQKILKILKMLAGNPFFIGFNKKNYNLLPNNPKFLTNFPKYIYKHKERLVNLEEIA